MTQQTVRVALRDAMAEEMRRDPEVVVMGDEVADFAGKVRRVDAAANATTRQVEVIVAFADPAAAPKVSGLFAEGRVETGGTQALTLAEASVVRAGESTFVWRVQSTALAKVAVKLGDRDPRTHEFSVQMRGMDNDKSGGGLGLPVLIALAGGLLERSTRGGLIIVGSLNLGGSLEMLPNAVALVEIAIEKQAAVLLMPVAARRQLNELPDELWTKINIEFYSEPQDAFFKALAE
jgi:predicted ATP-dependent Lon-type protease